MIITSPTVRGVHFGPGTSDTFDIPYWIDQLKQMGIGWVVFITDGESMRNMMKACQDNDIVPIARMYRHGPTGNKMSQKDLDAVKMLVQEGITRRIITRNEGNLPWEWEDGVLPQPIELAATKGAPNWLWEAEQVFNVGGLPCFEPLAQCNQDGNSSSIRYYRAYYNWLRDNAFTEVKDMLGKGLWQATHCATLNHYWADAKGYWHFEHPKNLGMSVMDDDCSLIGHELPLEMIFNRWGVRPDVISTEGGVFRIFRQWDTRYPSWIQNDQDVALMTERMYYWLEDYVLGLNGFGKHPEYLGMCPWILAQDILGHGGAWEEETWYPNRADPRPVIRKLRENKPRAVRGPAVPVPVQPPVPVPTPGPVPSPPSMVSVKGMRRDGTLVDPAVLLREYNMKITPCVGPGYRVVQIIERCEAANCDVWVMGPTGSLLPAQSVRWGWPGTEITQVTDPLGRAGFAIAASGKYDPLVGGGPHWTAVSGNSDRVDGIGLVMGTVHCTLNFTFRYLDSAPGSVPAPVIDDPVVVEFSRPPGDNGIGFHFGMPRSLEEVQEMISRAKGLGATWCTYMYTTEDSLRRDLRLIYDSGIMPVIRPVVNIKGGYPWARDVQICKDLGVPCYIQIFNEPSDIREWETERAYKNNYPGQFARWWAEAAVSVVDAGGYAGLQVLSPDELQAVFDVLPKDNWAWKRMWFSPHTYGLNHPPETEGDNWYALGFRMWAKLFIDHLGFVPPMIAGECGWFVGDGQDASYPAVSRQLHARYHRLMFEQFKTGVLCNGEPLPEYLFACNVWILSGPEHEAWYGPDVKFESIREMQDMGTFERYKGAVTPPVVVPPIVVPPVVVPPVVVPPVVVPTLTFNFVNAIRSQGVILHDRRDEFVKLVTDAGLVIEKRTGTDPLDSIVGMVVHDSGRLKDGTLPKPLNILKDHIVRGLGGAYHLMIEMNGEGTFSWPLKYVGNHCGRSVTNRASVGICFILDGTKEAPTPAQLKTYYAIKNALHQTLGGRVAGGDWGNFRDLWVTPHGWVVPTQCPGSFVEHAILWGKEIT